MTGIYIGSTTPRAGKSLLAFSLGLLLQKAGHSVGYMKPLGCIPQKVDELPGDADALVVQEVLGQDAPADILTPVLIPGNLRSLSLYENGAGKSETLLRIAAAYTELSRGRDVMLVSGTGVFPYTGRFCHAGGLAVARHLGLKTLLVERYSSQKFNYDALLTLGDMLGNNLLGIVLNDVPEKAMREATEVLTPYLEERGISVFGAIPREPGLASMRVAELAQGIAGCVVAGNGSTAREVKGFLIGTMQVDNFMMYIRRFKESAIIVGGDRADLQLVALHSNSPCVILTGNIAPTELVRARAEKAGVPIITVQGDTYVTARNVEKILQTKKMRDVGQIRLGARLVEASVRTEAIFARVLPLP